LDTAVGATEGLAALEERGPYAVVVSDLRMPEMDGIQFLCEVRKRAPDTVRLILSGNADLGAVIQSVNEGSIFQFLTKPCPTEALRRALDSALAQSKLITAERELLEGTLRGSIAMMTEVLSVVNPLAFSRGSRIRQYVRHMATTLHLPNPWQFELAAMLSQIGCIAVPTDVLQKVYAQMPRSGEEERVFASHPSIAHDLLAKIPRLEVVADIILNQMTPLRHLERSTFSDTVAVGAQMLMVAVFFDELVSRGTSPAVALETMRKRPEAYRAALVNALMSLSVSARATEQKVVALKELQPNMVINDAVRANNGFLLVTKGELVTPTLMARLKNFAQTIGVKEPILVLTDVVDASAPAMMPLDLTHA
jgi:CheY-like chemotaxis protein